MHQSVLISCTICYLILCSKRLCGGMCQRTKIKIRVLLLILGAGMTKSRAFAGFRSYIRHTWWLKKMLAGLSGSCFFTDMLYAQETVNS